MDISLFVVANLSGALGLNNGHTVAFSVVHWGLEFLRGKKKNHVT